MYPTPCQTPLQSLKSCLTLGGALVFFFLLLGAAPAGAANVHDFLYQVDFAGIQPSGGSKALGLAVDGSSGELYVGHTAASEAQSFRINGNPTGGTFTLTFRTCTTGPLAYNAPAKIEEEGPTGPESVEKALRALPCVGAPALVVGRPASERIWTYNLGAEEGAFAFRNLPQVTCDGSGLTGGSSPSCPAKTEQDGTPVAIAKLSPSASSDTFLCQITGLGEQAVEQSAECDSGTAGPGAFTRVRGLAIDASGDFLYADATTEGGQSAVFQFEAGGRYTGKFLDLGTASVTRIDVSSESGNVFVADESGDRVTEWDPATEATKTFASEAGAPLAPFGSVAGVAVDNDPSSPNHSDVYVVDGGAQAVDRFSPSGEYQCQITAQGSSSTSSSECSEAEPGDPAGGFSGLTGGIAVDPQSGHLYVGEVVPRQAVAEFTKAGDYVASISAPASGFFGPYSLAISPSSGDVFVASFGNGGEAFAFGPDKPVVHSAQASEVSATAATLHGTVNPLGLAVGECRFEYVKSGEWKPSAANPYANGSSVECEQAVGSGETTVSVSARPTLEAGSGYHFRLVATNANGTSFGEGEWFGPPVAKTAAATDLTQGTATLNGEVETENLDTHFYFEWGPTPAYGNKTPAEPGVDAGAGPTPVSAARALSGLQLGTEYHFRLVASDVSGTVHGQDRTFTTLPAATIDPISPFGVTATEATLQAYVNPLGSATDYHFEYGDQGPCGSNPCTPTPSVAIGGGEAPVLATAKVEGLQPNATYRFRTVTTNPNGTVVGPEETFATEPLSCPNEQFRTGASEALPDCRAFEMVSPPEEGPAERPMAGTTGELFQYRAKRPYAGDENPKGSIVGSEYLARRRADGWVSEAIYPPEQALEGILEADPTSQGASPDLSRSYWRAWPSDPFAPPHWMTVLMREPNGSYLQAAPRMESFGANLNESIHEWVSNISGGSADLSKLVLPTAVPLIPDSQQLNIERLYEISTAGPSPSIRLLNADNAGNPLQPCSLGVLGFGAPLEFPQLVSVNYWRHPISADGSKVFFAVETPAMGCASGGQNMQVLARVDGSETVSISDPAEKGECASTACAGAPISGAAFAGASADGSKVFFLSSRQLTDSASQGADTAAGSGGCRVAAGPNGCNLYMYDFGAASGHNLSALSAGDSSGGGPRVLDVLRTSEDGSRVYFVARGLLTGKANSLGQTAKAGADNLYLYDAASEAVSFVAELCSGEEESGTLTGVAGCSGNDENELLTNRDESTSTADGAIFAFTTYDRLTPDDTNESLDVYRYDAETGSLQRISIGHRGEDENGNGGGHPVHLFFVGAPGSNNPKGVGAGAAEPQLEAEDQRRAMSDDGQTITMFTTRPLQGSDVSGKEELYEWHQGEVSLVSGGHAFNDVEGAAMSPSGRDIVIETDAQLLPQDQDELRAIYDVRIGGGFPPPPNPTPQCEGSETCHGEGTNPGSPPGITHLEGAGNELHCHRGFVKRHGKCVKKHRRKHHRNRTRKRASGGRQGGRK